jgi:hypothetical protein
MEFEIDDAVLDKENELPKIVKDILIIVQKLPDGNFITTRKLGQLLNRSTNYINSHSAHPTLNQNRLTFHRKNLYGNESTVKAFKDKMGII